MNIKELSREINQWATEKGFWEKPNPAEKLMLIVSELGEAVEAHRSGRYCRAELNYIKPYEFEQEVKDTFEDELADVFIHLFDLCYKYNIELDPGKYAHDYRLEKIDNVAECLFFTIKCLVKVYEYGIDFKTLAERELTTFYLDLLYLTKKWRINIEKHIELKMKYNNTRPHKHDKNY